MQSRSDLDSELAKTTRFMSDGKACAASSEICLLIGCCYSFFCDCSRNLVNPVTFASNRTSQIVCYLETLNFAGKCDRN